MSNSLRRSLISGLGSSVLFMMGCGDDATDGAGGGTGVGGEGGGSASNAELDLEQAKNSFDAVIDGMPSELQAQLATALEDGLTTEQLDALLALDVEALGAIGLLQNDSFRAAWNIVLLTYEGPSFRDGPGPPTGGGGPRRSALTH